MQRRFSTASVIFALGIGAASAQQGLPPAKQLTVDAGVAAARAAMKACNDQNYRVSVAVVDADGLVKVQLRGDGVGPHSLDSSRQKAYTAATFKRSTVEVENFASVPNVRWNGFPICCSWGADCRSKLEKRSSGG